MFDAQMIVDVSGETPVRLARLELEVDEVRTLRMIADEAANMANHVAGVYQVHKEADRLVRFLSGLEKQLQRRPLSSMADFKAFREPITPEVDCGA